MKIYIGLIAVIALLAAGCAKQDAQKTAAGKKSEYVFAMIAKNQGDPVFQAARYGAEDAAGELSKKLGVKITARWQTPHEEDAQKQAQYIEQLVNQGIDGISISCTNAQTVTPAIDAAIRQGIPVMCFDSDAPNSKRFVYYGTDDMECGRTMMRELAQVLGPGKHVVAIPGGNQNALNIQNRVRGAMEEAKKYPNIAIRGVYYHKETPQDSAAKVEEVQTANPDIDGWAMVGAWSLFTDALMKWQPGRVKIVAVDALPAELPYLRKGIVSKLFAQQVYTWGTRSMELLADKVILNKAPAQTHEISPLVPVTQANVDSFAQSWKKWLHE